MKLNSEGFKKTELKNAIKKIPLYLLFIWAVFSVAAVIFYTAFESKQNVNSDIFDTLMWAKASYESGKIFSDSFEYAALLPFGGSLLMLPFIKLFGVSFTTHMIGLIIFELLFTAVIIAFGKAVEMKSSHILIFIISMCSLWLCADKFREMFLEHIIYYSLSIFFILSQYCLVNKLIKALEGENRKKSIAYAIGLLVFTALCATDGIQMIALSTMAVAGGIFLERFFDTKTKLLSKKNRSEIITVIIIAVATLMGLIMLKLASSGVVAAYEDTSSSFSNVEFIKDWIYKLKIFVVDWFLLFEVLFNEGAKLFAISQLPSIIRLLFSGLLLFIIPINAIFYKHIESKHVKRFFFTTLIIFAVTLYPWMFGNLSAGAWRLIPLITACFVLLLMDVFCLAGKKETVRFAVLGIALTLAFSLTAYSYVIAYSDSQPVSIAEEIITELDKHDIKNGYGEFFSANAVEIMSEGKYKVRNLNYKGGKIFELSDYQQNKNTESYGTAVFVIISTYDNKSFEKTELYTEGRDMLIDKSAVGGEYGYSLYFFSNDIYDLIKSAG